MLQNRGSHVTTSSRARGVAARGRGQHGGLLPRLPSVRPDHQEQRHLHQQDWKVCHLPALKIPAWAGCSWGRRSIWCTCLGRGGEGEDLKHHLLTVGWLSGGPWSYREKFNNGTGPHQEPEGAVLPVVRGQEGDGSPAAGRGEAAAADALALSPPHSYPRHHCSGTRVPASVTTLHRLHWWHHSAGPGLLQPATGGVGGGQARG